MATVFRATAPLAKEGERGQTQEREAGRGDKKPWLGRERWPGGDKRPLRSLTVSGVKCGGQHLGLVCLRGPQDGQVRRSRMVLRIQSPWWLAKCGSVGAGASIS